MIGWVIKGSRGFWVLLGFMVVCLICGGREISGVVVYVRVVGFYCVLEGLLGRYFCVEKDGVFFLG